VANELEELRVWTFGYEHEMKLIVHTHGFRGTGAGPELLIQTSQLLEPLERWKPGKPQGSGIEDRPHRVDRTNLFLGEGADEKTSAWDVPKSTFCDQPRQCLSKRRPADADSCSETNFVDAVPGGQCTAEYHVAKEVRHLLGKIYPAIESLHIVYSSSMGTAGQGVASPAALRPLRTHPCLTCSFTRRE
jgi:hypothetical protein